MARDLKLFYWFRLLATSYLWFPIFFLFKEARGLSLGEIFSLAGVYAVTVILIEIPTGAFADRIGRRTSMVFGALAMVASCLIAYIATDFASFVVAEIFAATSIALCSGADSAYLYDLLKAGGRDAEYARREGHASALHLGGSAIACAGGGLLAEIDLGLPFLVNAGVALVAFFIALAMRDHRPVAPKRAKTEEPIGEHLASYLALMRRAVRTVVTKRSLLWITGFSAVCFMLLRSTDYLYQPYLRGLGFGAWETGLAFAAIQLIAAFVAISTNGLRGRVGETSLLWLMLGALAGTFILLNQLDSRWALSMLVVQAGVIGLYSPLVKPIINRQIVDSSQRATVLSIESIGRRAAAGVFIPIIGLYGKTVAIDICGVAALVGLVVLLIAYPGRVPAAMPACRVAGSENAE